MKKKLFVLILNLMTWICLESGAQASLTDGLRLYYSFNSAPAGNTVTDQSGNANHGTIQGNVVYTPAGKIGGAMKFDGVDNNGVIDWIKANASPSLNVSGSSTIAAWYKVTSTNQAPIVEWNNIANGGTSGVHMWVNVYGYQWNGQGTGANYVDVNGNDVNYIINTSDHIINKWHHLAVTYDSASGNAQVYLDGVRANERNIGLIIPQTSSNLYVGARPDSEPRFTGLIDEVRIYDRVLSRDEIYSLVEYKLADSVTQVGFSNVTDGDLNLISFSKRGNFYATVRNLNLSSSATAPKVTAKIYQTVQGVETLKATVNLVKQADNTYKGSTPLSQLVVGKAKVVITGTAGTPVILNHQSDISITA
jgi:hypothetical protein